MSKRARKRTKSGHVKKARQVINARIEPRQTSTAVMPCGAQPVEPPKNTQTPCDVTLLQIKAATLQGNVPVPNANLQATARRIYEPAPANCPPRIEDDLTRYDFVIEAVSVDETILASDGTPDWNSIVQVAITGGWYGKCPQHAHPRLVTHPLDAADTDNFEKSWDSSATHKVDIPVYVPDLATKEFGWLSFPRGAPMLVEVSALSCGVRFDTNPVNQLKALLRIFPKDDWSITLKLPAIKEKKRGYSEKTDFRTGATEKTASKSESSLGQPVAKESSSETWNKKGVVTSYSTSKGKADEPGGTFVQKTEKMKDSEDDQPSFTTETSTTTGDGISGHTRTETTHNSDGIYKASDEDSARCSLTVTRNGCSIDALKALNTAIKIITRGKEAFAAFKETLKIVPKVGYTLDLSLILFEGSITFAAGYRLSPTLFSDRYTTVTPYVEVGFAMKIFEASIALGIGFDITIPNIVDWFATKNILEVVVKAEGRLTLGCSYNHTHKFQDDRQHEFKLTPSAAFKVDLVFAATVLGKGMKAEIGFRTKGFIASGRVVFSSSAPATVYADFALDSGNAYGYFFVDVSIWDCSKHFDQPVWNYHQYLNTQFPKLATA